MESIQITSGIIKLNQSHESEPKKPSSEVSSEQPQDIKEPTQEKQELEKDKQELQMDNDDGNITEIGSSSEVVENMVESVSEDVIPDANASNQEDMVSVDSTSASENVPNIVNESKTTKGLQFIY